MIFQWAIKVLIKKKKKFENFVLIRKGIESPVQA